MADALESYVSASQEDVAALARMPPVESFARLSESGTARNPDLSAEIEAMIAGQFGAMMEAKPRYDQIRLIGTADDGREIVRVDSRGAGMAPERIPAADLQSKAARPYFSSTLSLPPGGTYVSRIDYNRENGVIEQPPVPTMRVARPVRLDGRPPSLFVIVNVDIAPALRHLSIAANLSGAIYLVDEDGNYLVNTQDPDRVFGFEAARDFNLRKDWPALAGALDSSQSDVVVFEDRRDGEMAAAIWPITLAGTRRVTLIQIAPTQALVADTRSALATSVIIAGGLASLAAVLISPAIAAGLVRPIRALTKAVDGSRREQRVSLATDAKGEVGALSRAIARYMEREALLGALINSSFDAILTKDLEGIITSWNETAENLYGYTAREAIGEKLEDLIIPPERRSELASIMAEIRAGHRIGHFQTVRINKAGDRLDVSLTISPIQNAAGDIIGASTIARDVTQVLADARHLQRIQAEAAHTARITAAGQMAATLAHELNQPLTAVINYVRSIQRLQKDAGMAPESKPAAYAQKAVEQANRASEIVRRLRNFIGNRQTNVVRAKINDLIEEALALVLLGWKEEAITVERDYAPDPPDVIVDPVHVQQIVANLTKNAIEAMSLAPDRVLTVSTRHVGEIIRVRFADTGGGIDDAILASLFEPFTTTKRTGMGFGLNICRSLVEAQGGSLKVENAPEGAVFEFTLPIAEARAVFEL